MLKRDLGLYGGLLLLCQLLLSCNSQNNDEISDASQDRVAVIAENGAGAGAGDASNNGKAREQIIVFGDSLYAGYGLGPKEGLAPQLQQSLRAAGYNVAVRNAGVSGDTTAGGLRRLNFLLDSSGTDAKLVLLGLGGNDMLRGIPPSETRSNLDKILTELANRDIPVIVTGMLAAPNLGQDYAQQFNPIYPQLAEKYNAVLYPFILEGVVTNPKLMLDDNIHPNAQGVVTMTKGLLPLVEKRLKEPKE